VALPELDTETWKQLAESALEQRLRAHAPYSGFRVGAALLTADGQIITGCNVENASYGLTLCAERVAIASAVAAGQRRFRALAIAAETSPPPRPCGACLQVIAEFCSEDFPLVLVNGAGERERYRLADLLPHAFRLKTLE
jgi:cytidine deaminase